MGKQKKEFLFLVLSCPMTGIWTQFPVQLHRFCKTIRVYHLSLYVPTVRNVTADRNPQQSKSADFWPLASNNISQHA